MKPKRPTSLLRAIFQGKTMPQESSVNSSPIPDWWIENRKKLTGSSLALLGQTLCCLTWRRSLVLGGDLCFVVRAYG